MNALSPLTETTIAQRRAADPSLSAFVSANAGAGKTRVLTNRVARLLLAGVDPATILCITFTKAAAAEMAHRLFALLGRWALADDATLRAELADLDGEARQRGADELARARRLFARALETPGGLKIKTIHAFCESVLRRFPLEAGVAPGFSVIEEIEARSLAAAALDHAIETADGAVAAGFAHLAARRPGDLLRDLLTGCLGARRSFARAEAIGLDGLTEEVAAALGIDPALSSAPEIEALFALFAREDLQRARAGLAASGGAPAALCAPIDEILDSPVVETRLHALERLFCTGTKGAPRGKFGTAATGKIDSWIEGYLKDAQALYLPRIDRIRAAQAAEETRALHAVLGAGFAAYAGAKAARAALDFSDLIEKTRRLFSAPGGAEWVLFKLDQGLSHILLDEAQDTGPDAWQVIERPLEEFFAGESAAPAGRTFFAVGDKKQSIYSFQGADAALFKAKQEDLGKRINAAAPYAGVSLKASFRTTAPILAFVDALFAPDEAIDNVSDEKPLQHWCTRAGAGGFVELWPLAPRLETEKPVPWDAPLDVTGADSPPKRLAAEVARTIGGWLQTSEILPSQGRAIVPGDILILVQSRGPLFDEMIRALSVAGVPVAGADKLLLKDDQGVLDLLSYARAALYPGDDLSLAETLKSPFFGLDEDSLYALAAGRTGSLFGTLRRRTGERADWKRAHDEIMAARAVALGEGAVAFFAHILETGEPSGWRRLGARLGEGCREPIEELLRQAYDFEQRAPRSLRLFLDALERSGAEASREASAPGPTVRVMTVHKAKGLEANIVFLLDGQRYPVVGKIGDLVTLEGPHGDAIAVLTRPDTRKNAVIAAAVERMQRAMREEYRRLLYVAATRARDRLYVCGYTLGNDPNPEKKAIGRKSWHALAVDAFAALGAAAEPAGERFGRPALRIAAPQTAPVETAPAAAGDDDTPLPDHLSRPAPAEPRARRLTPSMLIPGEPSPYSPRRPAGAQLRGRLLHRLLELLPEVEPPARRAGARRLLALHAAGLAEDARAALVEEAMRVLEDPKFAPVFAPGSLGEVAIGGRPQGAGRDLRLSGQIDRLAVLPDRILVVDYKTNRPPPFRVEDVPDAYLAQMAAYRGLLREIYPGRAIEAALLWTFDARLMVLPEAALDRAQGLTLA